MNPPIEPRVLKGFRDFLPDKELQRLAIVRNLEEAFRLFGFLPIDTPALEYAEVLLGKGGGETDKQVYRFLDHGGRDVALRFDLTVPFARFMAAHLGELSLPFRRYHAAKVWRGENTQRGRYREFIQVDFDVVGADSASADLEILLLMRECFQLVVGEDGFGGEKRRNTPNDRQGEESRA
jgi:histidyl-tRNA synthetase